MDILERKLLNNKWIEIRKKKRGMFFTVSSLLPKEYEEEQKSKKKWCMLLWPNSLLTMEYEKEEEKKLDVLQRKLLANKGIE